MQCDVCKKAEATVFLTQIVNGKMQKINLCTSCSKAKGVNDPTGFALADLLHGLGASKEVETSPGLLKCPVCGFTQTDFKKTGRLGCSRCYDVFGDQLLIMIRNMHKGTRHIGKVPVKYQAEIEYKEKLRTLQQHLEEAIASEQYEKAADLRDQIRQLETEVELK